MNLVTYESGHWKRYRVKLDFFPIQTNSYVRINDIFFLLVCFRFILTCSFVLFKFMAQTNFRVACQNVVK